MRLVRDLQYLGAHVCLQETHLIPSNYEDILSKRFQLYSAYFDIHPRGVSWLAIRYLTTSSALVFANPESRLCALDVTIKAKTPRLNGVYAPNDKAERADIFDDASAASFSG